MLVGMVGKVPRGISVLLKEEELVEVARAKSEYLPKESVLVGVVEKIEREITSIHVKGKRVG